MDQFSLIFRKTVNNIDLASKMKLNIMTLLVIFFKTIMTLKCQEIQSFHDFCDNIRLQFDFV